MESLSAYVNHPKNSNFEGQEKDEEILLLLRRHFITNIKWIIAAIIMVFAPSTLKFLEINFLTTLSNNLRVVVSISWYLVIVIFIFENFLNWYFNVYIITNKRIIDIDFWGLLYRNVSEANLKNIQDVTYSVSGFYQTVFNYGDVIVQTAAERPEFDFGSVPNPAKVHDKLTDWVDLVIKGRRPH